MAAPSSRTKTFIDNSSTESFLISSLEIIGLKRSFNGHTFCANLECTKPTLQHICGVCQTVFCSLPCRTTSFLRGHHSCDHEISLSELLTVSFKISEGRRKVDQLKDQKQISDANEDLTRSLADKEAIDKERLLMSPKDLSAFHQYRRLKMQHYYVAYQALSHCLVHSVHKKEYQYKIFKVTCHLNALAELGTAVEIEKGVTTKVLAQIDQQFKEKLPKGKGEEYKK